MSGATDKVWGRQGGRVQKVVGAAAAGETVTALCDTCYGRFTLVPRDLNTACPSNCGGLLVRADVLIATLRGR